MLLNNISKAALLLVILYTDETAGRPGPAGPSGPAGPASGGVVFTRWGSRYCPGNNGTERVYSGTTAGTPGSYKDGAVNLICMPEDPSTHCHTSGALSLTSTWQSVKYCIQQQTSQLPHVPCA